MTDFLLTDDLELAADGNGDIACGESSGQVAYLILASVQGEWRRHAVVGVNVPAYMAAPGAVSSVLVAEADFQLNELEGLGLVVGSDGSALTVSR